MMVNSDIIHLCPSLKKIFHGESIQLPEEVHHIIMLPILVSPVFCYKVICEKTRLDV